MLNKHGRRLSGLKRAATRTKDAVNGLWCHIYYNYVFDEVYADIESDRYCYLLLEESWLPVITVNSPLTMQEISDYIEEAVYKFNCMRGLEEYYSDKDNWREEDAF